MNEWLHIFCNWMRKRIYFSLPWHGVTSFLQRKEKIIKKKRGMMKKKKKTRWIALFFTMSRAIMKSTKYNSAFSNFHTITCIALDHGSVLILFSQTVRLWFLIFTRFKFSRIWYVALCLTELLLDFTSFHVLNGNSSKSYAFIFVNSV